MLGLRSKLSFGFGGLLIILLTVSGLGIGMLVQHRGELDKFLYENWRSVEYGQAMVNALERLDDAARQAAGIAEQFRVDDLAAARAAAAPAIADFEKNLDLENRNITLPGEDRLASDLTTLWGTSGAPAGSYRPAYARLLAGNATTDERRAAYATVRALAPRVKTAAQAVIRLNLDNMKPIDGRVKAMSDNASRAMLILSLVGVAVAVIFIAIVSRSILRPVQTLMRSAREIEQGNLDLVVQVKSRDELRQLAEAFNSMAAKLREYRRTNRAKLVRTQQTTQLAINSLPDAVAILSPEGTIEMANLAAQRLFGLRADAQVHEFRGEWLANLYQRTSTTLKPVDPRGYESALQVLDEGGGEHFFLPHAVPILDDERQLLGVTVVLADVTNLRRLDEMKSGMLSVVSHELKTPLTSIRMGVHLLLEEQIGTLTSQQNDLLVAVRDDSNRLNEIVENLLDMGRIESGRALMDLRPEPAEQVAVHSAEPFRPAFQDKGVELVIDIPADAPAVLVDRTRIGHVFSNLLGNALKYTSPGGRARISAAAEEGDAAADGDVRFSVEDTGIGIPKQYLPHVFERFFRAPGQSGTGGAGLGLAIAKEIVEAHGGRIGVESREGAGTRFTFTLRRAPSDREHAESARPLEIDRAGRNGDSQQEIAHEVGAHIDRR
jgi:two-component system, NtrC family, sensor histidine kinase KinB